MTLGGRPAVYRLEPIPAGEAGTRATVRRMEEFTARAVRDPWIRTTALRILRGTPQHDGLREVAALHAWVQREIEYRRDPRGVEFVTDPVHTLTLRAGDCDDRSTLLAALLQSVGYHTRFAVSSTLGPDAPFQHVFPQVQLAGEWISVDPTRTLRPGQLYPGTTRVAVLQGDHFVNTGSVPFTVPRRMLADGSITRVCGIGLNGDGDFIYLGDDYFEDDGTLGGWLKKLRKVRPLRSIRKLRPLAVLKRTAGFAVPLLIPGAGAAAVAAGRQFATSRVVNAAASRVPVEVVDALADSTRVAAAGSTTRVARSAASGPPRGDFPPSSGAVATETDTGDDYAAGPAAVTAVPGGLPPAAGSPGSAARSAFPMPLILAGVAGLALLAVMGNKRR